MLGLGYKGSVTPYYLVGYRGVSEENSALIIYLFFILYYDQQMHNYLTKYHTPNSEVEQKWSEKSKVKWEVIEYEV